MPDPTIFPDVFPDDAIDTLRERDMQFEDELRSDWAKVNADREGWGWSLCPCGLMFYVERECQHGADLLTLADSLLCESDGCNEGADWLLVTRKRNPAAEGHSFRRYRLCDIHVWDEQDAHAAAGWECITPELF